MPGRPTSIEHRAPEDDLRRPFDRETAEPITKLHALTLTASEQQTHNYYMNIGPLFADPVARQLYAEIASIEQQHVTQYESLLDPAQSLLENWLLHEAMEVYNYFSCLQQESNPRIRQIWQRMLDYELGHFHLVAGLYEREHRRDPRALIPEDLPEPLPFESQREFVRKVLRAEVDLRARGTEIVAVNEESEATVAYRAHLNSQGSPSETVAQNYRWRPGTELAARVMNA
jgi:rubrerythrin